MTTDPATPPTALAADSALVVPGEGPAGDHPALLPGPPVPAGDSEVPEPVYTAVEDWVTDHFLRTFRRTLGGEYRWCGLWWRHDEAVSRLTALWHAWEVLRLQPGTGIATWYRDHLDHQMPVLMGARGPFYQCTETTHREPRAAEAIPAPGLPRHHPGYDPATESASTLRRFPGWLLERRPQAEACTVPELGRGPDLRTLRSGSGPATGGPSPRAGRCSGASRNVPVHPAGEVTVGQQHATGRRCAATARSR